jgi:protein-S-isoprenylcysteine O-methyltransferase Ste14
MSGRCGCSPDTEPGCCPASRRPRSSTMGHSASRNPLYVGLLAVYLGLALLAPTFWGLALFPAAVLLLFWGAIRPEERYLHDRFRAPYDDYTRRVRRWL